MQKVFLHEITIYCFQVNLQYEIFVGTKNGGITYSDKLLLFI